jgi:hypothetical protein
MSDALSDEIEVICSNCSFPTMVEYDDGGKVKEFVELEAPKTEEAALEAGWTDSGLGLLCPPCSAKAAADAKLAEAQGEVTAVGGVDPAAREAMKAAKLGTYFGMLKSMHPEISDATLHNFANVLRGFEGGTGLDRPLNLEELESLTGYYGPKDEAQAAEYLVVIETVKRALVKR